MTNHVRFLLRKHLSIKWLPYTTSQADALERISKSYPDTTQKKQQVLDFRVVCEGIIENVDKNLKNKALLANLDAFAESIEDFYTQLYRIPKQYFWIVLSYARRTLDAIHRVTNDTVPYTTASQYLANYKPDYDDLMDFEPQLVNDITELMIFSYPHPEMVIALEKAQKILSLYYTPIEISKLFVDDMQYKIQQYIDTAKQKLPEPLIEYFRNPPMEEKKDIEKPKDSVEQQYQTYLQYLKTYQATGTMLRELLELHQVMLSLPFKDTQRLTGFRENLWWVSHLNQPTTRTQ